jgi:hypothetical protein
MDVNSRLLMLNENKVELNEVPLSQFSPFIRQPSASFAVVERELVGSLSMLQDDRPISPYQLSSFFNFCELFCLYEQLIIGEHTSFIDTVHDIPVRFLISEGILNIDVTFLKDSSREKSGVPSDIAEHKRVTIFGQQTILESKIKDYTQFAALVENATGFYENAKHRDMDNTSNANQNPIGKPLVIEKGDELRIPKDEISYLRSVGNFFTGKEGENPDEENDYANFISQQLTEIIYGMGYEFLLGHHYQPSNPTTQTFLNLIQPQQRNTEILCALKAYELLKQRDRELREARAEYGWQDKFNIPPIVQMLLDRIDSRKAILQELFALREKFKPIRKLFIEFHELSKDKTISHKMWVKNKKAIEEALSAVAAQYGPPDARIHALATDSVDIIKIDNIADGIAPEDISAKGLVKFFLKKPADYLFQLIKARKLKTFYTMVEKGLLISNHAGTLEKVFAITWNQQYQQGLNQVSAPIDFIVFTNKNTMTAIEKNESNS